MFFTCGIFLKGQLTAQTSPSFETMPNTSLLYTTWTKRMQTKQSVTNRRTHNFQIKTLQVNVQVNKALIGAKLSIAIL